MAHYLSIAFLGLVLIFTGVVTANASDPGFKVGFVDLERTLYETKVGKSASAKFDTARKDKQKELDRRQKKLQKEAAQLEKQQQILKPDVFAGKRRALEKQYMEVQQLFVKLERDLAGERAKLIQGILKKAAPLIKDIAKKEGFTMIVDRSAVLWASDLFDITPKVNRRIK